MKFGVPWSVKGIRPEARETAKEAARRSGVPLGEWLNSVILQQASNRDDDEDIFGPEALGQDMSAVHERLDDITRRIDQFSRKGPEAYAPRQNRQQQPQPAPARGESDQLAQLIARLDQRLEQFNQLPRLMAQYAPPLAPPQHMAPPQHLMQPPQMPQWAPQMPPAPMQAPIPAQMPFAPPAAPQQIAQPANQPPMPLGLDRAVAEIAARQRSLMGGAPQARPQPAGMPRTAAPQSQPQQYQPQPQHQPPQQQPQPMPAAAYMPAPVPTQDLSGLEQHLRQITDQIETLRRPGVEDAINALRGELGDIGRALNDAMPRQAIDTIEKQIQGLTHRIAEGRQNGADQGALSGIEHGLAEVRDALRGLTPAESLVGFNEAVDGLAHKIDLIVAQRDPQTLGQLEHAITTLREMAGHVASNEAVGRLAAQVHELGAKVDHFAATAGGSDALNHLEYRISALADALAQRSESGVSVPPRLEALVESLSNKIEQIQHKRGDNVAAAHLEDQIVALVQRLDASDSRLGHLEVIERGLADLLVHIEEIRANKSPTGLRGEDTGVSELKHEIARTQNALDAVHGTLGLVVDRLATIEQGVRGEPRGAAYDEPLELNQPFGKIAARAVNQEPVPAPQPAPRQPQFEALFEAPDQKVPPVQPPQQPAPELAAALTAPQYQVEPYAQQAAPQQPAPQPIPQQQQPAPQQSAPKRLPPVARLPINPDLPPDQPLEPGQAAPRFPANPGARIAASEAALGSSRPQAPTGPAGKSGFIAAARRAAQTAMESAKPRKPEPVPPTETYDFEDDDRPSLRASVMKKAKAVLIAASVVAIVIGGIQIASNFFNFGSTQAPETTSTDTAPAQDGGTVAPALDNPAADPSDPPTTQSLSSLQSRGLPGYMITAPKGVGTIGAATGVNPVTNVPSLLSAPALNPPPATAPNDITGSIGRPTRVRPAAPMTSLPAPEGDLPIAIGGAKLREAAIGGDAGAAYEVAMRFAEGRGVAASPDEAARWYERASSKGLPPAQFRYASMLEKGQGVKKNIGQARKLYMAAAAKGHAKAMHNLAVLYAEGIDGKPDYITAAQWFRKAALLGVGDSQYNLGVLCARGLGVTKNLAEAYQWFALAAVQGDRESLRKRDEVAAHLEAADLTAAQAAVKDFTAGKQPQEATNVPAPRGGWDDAPAEAPASARSSAKSPPVPVAKPNTQRALSALPLNMSDYARR